MRRFYGIGITIGIILLIAISYLLYDPSHATLHLSSQSERDIRFNQHGILAITGKNETTLWNWQHDQIEIVPIPAVSVDWSNNNRSLALGSYTNTIKIINSSDNTIVQIIPDQGFANHALEWSYDDQFLAGQRWQNGMVTVWSSNDVTRRMQHEAGRNYGLLAWHPAQNILAYTTTRNERPVVQQWDLETNRITTIITSTIAIEAITWNGDGSMMILAGAWKFDTGVIEFWSLDQGVWIIQNRIEVPHVHLWSLAVNPQGTLIAASGGRSDRDAPKEDSSIFVWDIATGKIQYTLKGHQDTVTSLAFSLDGRVLASASWDNTVRVWELK